jgi:hypothetical protein
LVASDGPFIVFANSLPYFASTTERIISPQSSFLARSAGWLEVVDDRRVARVCFSGRIIVAGHFQIGCIDGGGQARTYRSGRCITNKQ